MKKHIGDLALFAILLSLLFLPIGTFGFAEIKESEENVLSIINVRTISIEDVEESTEATSSEQEEEILDEGVTAPVRDEGLAN